MTVLRVKLAWATFEAIVVTRTTGHASAMLSIASRDTRSVSQTIANATGVTAFTIGEAKGLGIQTSAIFVELGLDLTDYN